MKTIGILGGMGSYATADFFKRILDAFPAEKEWDRPRIIIDNNCVMPSRVRAILYKEKYEDLISQMSQSVNALSDSGAEVIMLGCMTAHHFLPYLPHQDKLVSITNLLREDVKNEGEILVLCTEGSVVAKVWTNTLSEHKLFYPNEEQMLEVRKFIEIVKTGKAEMDSIQAFARFVNSLPCEAVVLGCTELPILAKGNGISKRIYDPLQSAIDYLKKKI